MAHQGASEYARAPSRKRDETQIKGDGDEESDSECCSSDSSLSPPSRDARPMAHKRAKQMMHGEGAPGGRATAFHKSHSMSGGSLYDLAKLAYDASSDPLVRLFYDTNRIHREFQRSARDEFGPQLMAGQPRPPPEAEAPPPSPPPPPPPPPPPATQTPEAPKATTGPTSTKPATLPTPRTQAIKPLDSRPLPSPTAYLDQLFASGLLDDIDRGLEQEIRLSSRQPKQELMTQRVQDPRVTKARLDREKRELAIAKRRAKYVSRV